MFLVYKVQMKLYIVYMLKVNMTFSLQYNNNTQLAQLNESQLVKGQQKKCSYCDHPKLEVEYGNIFVIAELSDLF